MTRRKFIYDPELKEMVEVTLDYEQPTREARNFLTSDAIYDGMRATDGTPIDTRAKHREYMRRNNLTTADDFKETWNKDVQKRADYFTGKRGTVTRGDIGRAIHQLESQNRKR